MENNSPESVASRPTESELDLELADLVNWQKFAIHLPYLTRGDIEEIELNNPQNVAQQKLKLFGKWLQKSPDASWNDVVSALEKAQQKRLSDTIRKKFHAPPPTSSLPSDSDLQTIDELQSISRTSNVLDLPSREAVVAQLKQLHRSYTLLAREIHKKINELFKTGKLPLDDVLLYLRIAQLNHVTGLTEIRNVDELLDIIHKHNDFLDCEFLEMVVEECLLTDNLHTRLRKHMQAVKQFKSTTPIMSLKDDLRQFTTKDNISNNAIIVSIKLHDDWGRITLDLVEKLIKNLLGKHYAKWVEVWFGSVCVMLLIPENTENISQSLINSSSQRLEFMRLTGVFSLQIGTTVVLQEDENRNFTFDSGLLESSVSGNNEAVEFLLDLGVNVNYSNSEGKTVLMLASEAGHEEVVQTLISAKANVNLQNSAGQTALMLADRNVGILCHLLLANADPNLQRKDGNTALHIACYKRQRTCAEALLSFGATFIIPNTKGDTAFLASVRGNNTEILKLILNSIPHSPFIVSLGVVYACRFGHSAVFNLFVKQLEYTARIANFFISCAEGDLGSVIQHIMEFNIDPNTTLISGITPLMIASSFGNADVLDCLLQAEADVNSIDQDGYSPLTYAVTGNTSLHIVQRLLEAGGNPNVLVGGVTILERAREKGEQTICDLLLKYLALHLYKRFIHLVDRIQEGIDTLIKGGKGILLQITQQLETNFHLTGLTSKVQTSIDLFNQLTPYYDFLHFEMLVTIVREFLKGDIENEVEEYHGMATNFEESVEIQHFKDVLSLIPQQEVMISTSCSELTFKLNRQWGNLTLKSLRRLYSYLLSDYQAYLSHMTVDIVEEVLCIKFLIPKLTQVVDLASEKTKKEKLLYLFGVIEIMLDDILVLTVDEDKNFTFDSAFLESSQCGNNEAVQFLLDLGVNVNYSNSEGKTALMLACEAGHEEVVKTLASSGANVNLQDNIGCTALMFSNTKGIFSLLLQSNADINILTHKGSTPLIVASYLGHLSVVEMLLVEYNNDPNVLNEVGLTALFFASFRDHCQVVEILLEKGGDPNIHDNNGWTVLINAAQNGHQQVVELLLERQVDPNVRNSKNRRTALIQASQNGHYQVVEILLEKGADPNIQEDGVTALLLASLRGHYQVAKILLKKGADSNIHHNDGWTALIASSETGHQQVVELLLERQVDPNVRNSKNRRTALIQASQNGHYQVVEILLEKGADPNLEDENGATALLLASLRGHYQVAKILLEKGADSNIHHNDGWTALIASSETGHQQVVELLLERQVDPNVRNSKNKRTALIQASQNGHYQVVEILLEKGADPNIQEDGVTALLLASLRGHHQVVEVLLEKGADPNIQEVDGDTALSLASLNGHCQVVKILLEKGGDPNIHDNNGWTALINAAQNGHQQVVELLLERQVDPNVRNSKNRRTALTQASQNGHYQVVEILLEKGADPNIQEDGVTALLLASLRGHHQVAEILLEKGADPNMLNKVGVTALSLASLNGHCQVVEILLEKGADPNLEDENGATALLLTSLRGHYKLAKILLEKGADSNIHHNDGWTALIASSETGHQQVVELLLERQVDPNVRNSKNRRTALIQASQNGHYQVVEILLEKGADPNLEDENGATALLLASLRGHYKVAKILLEKGADSNIHHNDGWTALIASSETGHQQVVELLLERQVDPNVRNSKNRRTALIQASQNGHYQVVEILLEKGADPNIQEDGVTALLLASLRGHYQVAKILLEKGADSNIHHNDGWTALIASSETGHQQVVELLLERQVDPNVRNSKNRRTALIQASQNGHYQVVEILLEKGADPNIQEDGVTALLLASLRGHYQVAEILLEKGADSNIHHNDGWTALIASCETGHQQVVELLLERQVDPMIASSCGHTDIVEALIRDGVNINKKDEFGCTALDFATALEQDTTENILLQHGGIKGPGIKIEIPDDRFFGKEETTSEEHKLPTDTNRNTKSYHILREIELVQKQRLYSSEKEALTQSSQNTISNLYHDEHLDNRDYSKSVHRSEISVF